MLGEDGTERAPGEIGEIYLMPAGGPASSYHYIGAEAKKADGGWETLGDIGWLDADGYLYLADRRADIPFMTGIITQIAQFEAEIDQILAGGLHRRQHRFFGRVYG